MKKRVCLMTVLLLMITLVSCANSESKKEENEMDVDLQEKNSDELIEVELPETVEVELPKDVKTAKVPGKEIYVDFSSKMKKVEEANTILMYSTNDALVGLSFDNEGGFTGTLEEVIDLFKFDFIVDASTASSGWLYGAEIKNVSTEHVEIAGRESVKFIGTVLNKETWECHVYGYTFIIEETPCAVIGLVSAQDQDETIINEINDRVDEIANTIRTTK